jgi:hypothetical protein
MTTLVTGVFRDRSTASHAVEQLTTNGFGRQEISVVMSESTRGREFAVTEGTKAPEGATVGAAAGGTIGAVVAGLVAVGSIAIPGLGLLAAGPVIAALAGAGAGGAAGGLIGGLVGAGIPEHEAKFFEEEVKNGGILIGVQVQPERAGFAKELLRAAGGETVRTTST